MKAEVIDQLREFLAAPFQTDGWGDGQYSIEVEIVDETMLHVVITFIGHEFHRTFFYRNDRDLVMVTTGEGEMPIDPRQRNGNRSVILDLLAEAAHELSKRK